MVICVAQYASTLRWLLEPSNPSVRFWALQGCLMHGRDVEAARNAIRARLDDDCPDVAIAAAEWLCAIGEMDDSREKLAGLLGHENEWVRLHAANVIDYLNKDASMYTQLMREHFVNDESGYVKRVMEKALTDLGEKLPEPNN